MKNINQIIDHTLLKTNATKRQIETLCEQAVRNNFAAVCINPCHLINAKKLLLGTNVKLCTVVGFPLGQNTTAIKVKETEDAISNGANEIDVVMNIGKLIDKDYPFVVNELKKIKAIAGARCVKVIIETCLLSNDNKVKATQLVIDANCDYVKTSTGVIPYSHATVEDVKLLAKTAAGKIKVKASGGIATHEDALKMIEAGADRIGTSKSLTIIGK